MVSSQARETDLSLHSSDFRPQGSPGYTPRSPTLDWVVGDQVVVAVFVRFTELKCADKNKRLNEAMRIICTDIDREHINHTLGKTETNELYHSWLDVSLLSNSVSFFSILLYF